MHSPYKHLEDWHNSLPTSISPYLLISHIKLSLVSMKKKKYFNAKYFGLHKTKVNFQDLFEEITLLKLKKIYLPHNIYYICIFFLLIYWQHLIKFMCIGPGNNSVLCLNLRLVFYLDNIQSFKANYSKGKEKLKEV